MTGAPSPTGEGRTSWTRRSRIRQFVETAAWPIPAAYLIAACLLGIGMPWLDRRIGGAVPAEFSVGAAQALLTAFATGLITVLGLTISLVIAGVTFSGTSVSPRIVREMQRATTIRHVFGLLLLSIVYAFLVLNRVGPPGDPAYVPDLAVWLVTPLLVCDVVGLLLLVREMGHALRLVEIIDSIHRRARRVIDTIYWEKLGADQDDQQSTGALEAPPYTVRNRGRSGIVASLDVTRIVTESARVDTTLELARSIGSYVPVGEPLFHAADRRPDLDEDCLQRAVTLADERTIDQDPLYALRLLVDIATRALSPAVNDPTTAVQVLDRIADLLRQLAHRRLDRGTIRDAAGDARLVVPLPAWEDYLEAALTEIRQYGGTSAQVVRRLRAVLRDLLADAPHCRGPALERQLVALDRTIAGCFPDAADRELALIADRNGLGEPRAFARRDGERRSSS
jgi:uncharacterized membrane protein